MIDLGRAFKAPFEDKDWLTKTLLGLLWGILVVTAPAVSGAQLAYIRGVSSGDERLPSWDDFGTKWVEGLLVFVAALLYFLPVVVLAVLFVVPVAVTAVLNGGGDGGLLGGLFAGGMCLFWLVAMVYGIAVSVLFSAAMTNYAMKRNFGAFFEFGNIMALVRGNTGYFTAWIYTILIAFAGSIVTSILTATYVGGVLVTGVTYLIAMMSGHVLGQWAARAFGTPGIAAPAGAYPSAPASPPAPPAAFAPPPPAAAPPAPPALDEPVAPGKETGTALDEPAVAEPAPAEAEPPMEPASSEADEGAPAE